jgi:hypothetical protein
MVHRRRRLVPVPVRWERDRRPGADRRFTPLLAAHMAAALRPREVV